MLFSFKRLLRLAIPVYMETRDFPKSGVDITLW